MGTNEAKTKVNVQKAIGNRKGSGGSAAYILAAFAKGLLNIFRGKSIDVRLANSGYNEATYKDAKKAGKLEKCYISGLDLSNTHFIFKVGSKEYKIGQAVGKVLIQSLEAIEADFQKAVIEAAKKQPKKAVNE